MLDGARRMSPIPPPLRNPWLRVVTMHMMSESQALSLSAGSSAAVKALVVSSEHVTQVSCKITVHFDKKIVFKENVADNGEHVDEDKGEDGS